MENLADQPGLYRGRVTRAYRSPYSDPWRVQKGDQLRLEDRPSEWPGWIWCISQSGEGRWVPENWVRRNGSIGIATREYVARELAVQTGDVLTVLEEESSWAWCRDQRGEFGWVPLANLEKIVDTLS